MEISELRLQIDETDDQILKLLNQRAFIASEIGKIKKENLKSNPPLYDPKRELKVIDRLQKFSKGPFPSKALAYVFGEIMSACRSLESSMKIAYLGPPGTYTQIAASRLFGKSSEFMEYPSIKSLVDALERQQVNFAVIPFANSSQGSVRQSLDAILHSNLLISAETDIQVDHCLLSSDQALRDISRIYSHPQALSQCKRWLAENLPWAKKIETDSTAAAAQLASKEPQSAAIASPFTAELYSLKILKEGIQDQAQNTTRFVVLGEQDRAPTGKDRTSLFCILKDKAGSLHSVLDSFAKAGIVLSRLESYPHELESWKQNYLIDILGHHLEPKIKKALRQAARYCRELKVLGSYPVGIEGNT